MLTTPGQLCGLRKWLALSETQFPCLWNKDCNSVHLTSLFWGWSEKVHHTTGCSAARAQSCQTLQPCGLRPARLLWPWDFLGKNTWAGCHFLLQGIFPTQGPNRSSPASPALQADSLPTEPWRKPGRRARPMAHARGHELIQRSAKNAPPTNLCSKGRAQPQFLLFRFLVSDVRKVTLDSNVSHI